MLIPSQLGKASWNCVALPLIQQLPPPPLALPLQTQCNVDIM